LTCTNSNIRDYFVSAGVSPIITFDEFIDIALNAKRVVGIYPEMKNPV
jgi:hypothetical protein